AHGGCQAGCLLFWKEEWLKPVVSPASGNAERRTQQRSRESGTGCTEAQVRGHTTASASNGADPQYVCQTTQLPYATRHLAWWDIRQYVEDYRSGNVGLWRIVCGLTHSIYYHIK